jgi:proteasome lid subunit RPN8/RPN11
MTAPFRLSIPQAIFEAMLAHARAELPAECCGQLAGTVVDGVGRVTQCFPLTNELKSPTEFLSDPRSTFAAHKALQASGTEVLAVYHSHPTSDPIPSRRDLERSYGEHVMNLIIGLRKALPEVNAWWLLSTHEAKEAEFTIEPVQQ